MLECLHIDAENYISDLLKRGIKIKCAYIDPPYFTQRIFLTNENAFAFNDKFKSIEEYVITIQNVVAKIHDVLADNGVFWLRYQ